MGQWPERLIICASRAIASRNAEGFVPGERGFLEQDPDGFGRGVLQDRGERDRPARHCRAAPVVDLACGDAGDAGEGGLADAGAGEQGGELGVQQRSHGALGMELTSIGAIGNAYREAT